MIGNGLERIDDGWKYEKKHLFTTLCLTMIREVVYTSANAFIFSV